MLLSYATPREVKSLRIEKRKDIEQQVGNQELIWKVNKNATTGVYL